MRASDPDQSKGPFSNRNFQGVLDREHVEPNFPGWPRNVRGLNPRLIIIADNNFAPGRDVIESEYIVQIKDISCK